MTKDIKYDSKNFRTHDSFNKDIIKKSLSEYGAGRSILLDKDGVIIAGNGTYEQAKELGMPVRVIESDGIELIALQRVDLATSDKKRKGLSVMYNSGSDLSKFDVERLKDTYSVPELQEYGVPVFEATEVDSSGFFEDNHEVKDKEKKKIVCSHCGKEFEI